MKVYKQDTIHHSQNSKEERPDLLAVEEPLEIRLDFLSKSRRIEKPLAVTMRTPGNDFELAIGFLFSEGIISDYSQVQSLNYCQMVPPEAQGNVIIVKLADEVEVDWAKLERHFYATSSCGICGKSSLEQVKCSIPERKTKNISLDKKTIFSLSEKAYQNQDAFKFTGALHSAVLFDIKGEFIYQREDIGRHNALDKLIGAMLAEKRNAQDYMLWLSGRSGFELVQKAIVAGFPILFSVGAPSSLACQLAEENNLILIGFLRENKFNIYSAKELLEIKD